MEIGLVGKPSVGKSTFFSAITMIDVPISDRPFTTIEPNVGVGYVRVEDLGVELGVQSNPRSGFILGKYRFVPVKIIDVAGLVPGAHEGRGLGNKFLNDLNQAEGLLHIIDLSGSTDEEGNFVGYGKYDPEKDILFLERELDFWYKDILERNRPKIEREIKAGKEPWEALYSVFSSLRVTEEVAREAMEKYDLNSEELPQFLRKKSKKIVIVGNKKDAPHAMENYDRLKDRWDIIPVSAEAELALRKAAKAGLIKYVYGESDFEIIGELNEKQREALERIRKIMPTNVQQALEHLVFDVLGYVAVFPAGSKLKDKQGRVLPDCFLMKKGSTVMDFAKTIHSDIAKGLLYGIDLRTKRRLAKDYVLKHRDAIELVSAGSRG
ncbi:MAG: redox-regulated ATPase YchF [Candidatus Micrarchaeota archaeon]|nr:redox-regulated ATPase YchF [Candidatus Micrarchaeota archaeon]